MEAEVREAICVALGMTVGILLLCGGMQNTVLAFTLFLAGMFVAYN